MRAREIQSKLTLISDSNQNHLERLSLTGVFCCAEQKNRRQRRKQSHRYDPYSPINQSDWNHRQSDPLALTVGGKGIRVRIMAIGAILI